MLRQKYGICTVSTLSQAVCSEYATMGARVGPHQRVMFEGKEITLGIPPEGIILKTGWTITPLVHPSVRQLILI